MVRRFDRARRYWILGIAVVAFCAAMLVGGCKTPEARGYVEKTQVEKQIADLHASFQQKLEQSNRDIITAKDAVIAGKDAQLLAVAEAMYGSDVLFKGIIQPTRNELIFHNLAEEAWVATGRLLPSYEQMVKMNERIARELDETKTSLADLKRTHDAVVAQNAKLSDETRVALDKAKAAERAKEELKEAYSIQVADLQQRLNAANDQVIAFEKQRGDDAKARQAVMTRISLGSGVLAALCLAGAVFFPAGRLGLGILAAGFLGASVGIWYLTPEVLGVTVGVIVIFGFLYAVLKHRWDEKKLAQALETEKSAATDTYRAIQRVKENSPDVYEATVKPELVEAHLKYVTTPDGKISKSEDPERQAFIDARLAEVGDK